MPTYEYECQACGHKFEAFQNMTAKHLTKCPKCNKKVKRLIGSGSGIIFKGPGFYATDYKKSSHSKENTNTCSSQTPACKGCHMKGH